MKHISNIKDGAYIIVSRRQAKHMCEGNTMDWDSNGMGLVIWFDTEAEALAFCRWPDCTVEKFNGKSHTTRYGHTERSHWCLGY